MFDEAALAIKNREEELDAGAHEAMLGKVFALCLHILLVLSLCLQLDKMRRSLMRMQKKLNFELGTKLVANEVDLEALALTPELNEDPPEPTPPYKARNSTSAGG